MLTTLKSEPTLLFCFMKYVIAASHPKMCRRFISSRSKEYWQFFDSVKLEDIPFRTIQAASERKRFHIELENDRKFLIILGKGIIVPGYEERFPNIANVFKELPNLKDETSPDMTAHSATTFELFNEMTWKEYHPLFVVLMHLYKDLVNRIASKAKNMEPFEADLNHAVETGHALLTMVKGRAFYLYLSTIVSKLSNNFSEGSRIVSEEQDVEVGTTLWDSVEVDTATALWKPYKSWVMLMLVQLDAADALCAFVKQEEIRNSEIEVKLVYSPLVSDETIPLEVLLTRTYIPEAPRTDSKTNAKLLDFIKTATTLKRQAELVGSFTQKWDSKRASEAKSFIQQVLDETKREHEEDSKRMISGVDSNMIGLSSQIIELLSQPVRDASADILAKFSALEIELKEKQAMYNLPFTEKATFKGTLHCEVGMASILDKTTRENIQARIDTSNQADGKKKDDQLYRSLLQILEATKVGFLSVRHVTCSYS